MAIVDAQPLRLRSWPQPQRITAGEIVPYHSATVARSAAERPASAAARSIDHGSAAWRSSLAPVACAARKASSARPRSKRSRTSASATTTSVPGRTARCRSAWRASGVRRGSITTSFAPSFCARLMCDTRWMPGRRRIAAPDDDEPRVFVVGVGDAGHLAVHLRRRLAGRRGADGAVQPRRTEAAEEPGVLELVGEQAVRAAVVEGQHGLGAERVARMAQPPFDHVERFIPGDAREAGLALRALAHGRVQQPILVIHAPIEAPHLAADVAARGRRAVVAVDPHEPAALDRDVEAAGVGAIERAGGLNRRSAPGARRADGRVGHGSV